MNQFHTTTGQFDKAAIVRRAWELFRAAYNFPAVPFKSIGRDGFAWALKEAWREARATPPTPVQNSERVAHISREIEHLDYQPLRVDIRKERVRLQGELVALAA